MRLRRLSLGPAGALCLFAMAGAAQQPRSGYFTTTDGVRLHYLEAGRGAAIVFQPGWTMPASIWELQIRHFARRYRVVAIDPRSQGDSQQTTEGHYPARRARDIHELVAALKLAPAVLVGWSMGVPELLTYADEFGSSTIRALVLVDGEIGREPDARRLASFAAWTRSLQADRPKATAAFVRGMYKRPQPEVYYNTVTRAALRTPTNTAMALLLNTLLAGDRRAVLAKIDRPVLFAGTTAAKEQADLLKSRLPSARTEIFPDAGHALFVDEAARFNALLEEFLAALK